MKNLNNYIIEKLRITKDSVHDSSNLIPDDAIFDKLINSDMLKFKKFNKIHAQSLCNRLKTAESLIKHWIALMLLTGSRPMINKENDKIISFPGNYGYTFLDKAFKINKNITNNDAIDAYNEAFNKYGDNYYNDTYNTLIKMSIDSLLKPISSVCTYKLKPFSHDSYSKIIQYNINRLLTGNFLFIPFTVDYKNQSADCEMIVSISGGYYYGFYVNGENCKYYNDFLIKLSNELGI